MKESYRKIALGSETDEVYTSHVDPFLGFYKNSNSLLSSWISVDSVNQKFVNLFLSQPKQTLTLNN